MLRAIALSFTLLVAARGQQLEIQDAEIATLIADKSGNASINLTLKNGAVAAPVELTANFKHELLDGLKYPLSTTLTVVGVTSDDTANLKSLKPGTTVRVKLTVSQISEAGESVANLLNVGVPVIFKGKPAELHALLLPAAYNVQFETQNPEALFAPFSSPVVRLVNKDAMTYQFDWELVPQRGEPTPGEPPITLPANGTVDLDLSSAGFQGSLFQAGTLKDDVQDATLVLKPNFKITSIPPQPAKRLPLKMRLRYWGGPRQEVWAFFWTFLFLGLGAWLSLFFRIYIPNAAGAFKLKRQLCEMDEKINGTGEDLPSQWRVLLHWRFEKCREDVSAGSWGTPSFTTSLAAQQTRADMYAQWVEIAYAVSVVLGEATGTLQTGVPPTLFRFIQDKCNEAMAPIATGFTTPEDLQSMKTAVKAAEDYTRSIKTNAVIPSLETAIAEREKTLTAGTVLADLQKRFPQFRCTLDQVKVSSTMPLGPRVYFDRDAFSLKANLLREFWELETRVCCNNKPAHAEAPPDGKAADGAEPAEPQTAGPTHAETAAGRLGLKCKEFIEYLTPDAYSSVRIAQLFMAEMRQDFYAQPALVDAIKEGPPAIAVHVHPQSEVAAAQEAGVVKTTVQPGEVGVNEARSRSGVMRINRDAVQFALRFQREQLNGVAAVQEWTCDWNFGDGTEHEHGWAVYHRYSEVGDYDITVTVVDLNGKQVGSAIRAKVSVKDSWTNAQPSLWRQGPIRSAEAKLELMRILFVLGIALAGVFVTARGKVEAMDIFQGAGALIALGFGVDTLKTLLTQKAGDSQ